MNIEEELTKINEKMDKYHEEDKKKANRDKYMNLSYILWGFALATVGLTIALPNIITGVIAAAFVIFGFVALWYSAKFKEA